MMTALKVHLGRFSEALSGGVIDISSAVESRRRLTRGNRSRDLLAAIKRLKGESLPVTGELETCLRNRESSPASAILAMKGATYSGRRFSTVGVGSPLVNPLLKARGFCFRSACAVGQEGDVWLRLSLMCSPPVRL